MVQFTRGIGGRTKPTVRANLLLKMGIIMKDSGIIMWLKVMELFSQDVKT
jgi:hypothetical protein